MAPQGFCNNQRSASHRFALPVSYIKPLALGLLVAGTITYPTVTPANQPTAATPAPVQLAQATTILYVNPALGQDNPQAGKSDNTPLRTITYALRQAVPGTVIQLAPGSYTRDSGEVFPLVMQPGVVLRGSENNKGETVAIIGGGSHISPTFAGQNVTIVSTKDSEIRGVSITNPNTRGTGIWIEANNSLVENSTFSRSLREGIFITGAANPRIFNNVFVKNDANGISVASVAQGEIRSNLFQDTGFGLAIGGRSAPLVDGNRIIGNVDGLYINDSARPILRNNLIERNRRDGVVVTINGLPDLGTNESKGNNRIRDNGQFDVRNATSSNVVLALGNDIDPRRISGRVELSEVATATGNFRDVEGHWAKPYIEALTAKGIITGFPDRSFRPGDPVTRAQFASIITRAFSPASQRGGVSFRDVPSSFWGATFIQSAVRGGFMAGYPQGTFQPGQAIPRVQVLVSLVNGLGLGNGSRAVLNRFRDAGEIPSYAIGPVATATQRQIVVNYPTPNQLNPNRPATRAEVAAFVYQALVNAGKAQAIPSPYIVMNP